MITSSGPVCDVCGNYILPLDEFERVNEFRIRQIAATLHCHNKCKEAILYCQGDWEKLPDGPIRKLYATTKKEMDDAQMTDEQPCEKNE